MGGNLLQLVADDGHLYDDALVLLLGEYRYVSGCERCSFMGDVLRWFAV